MPSVDNVGAILEAVKKPEAMKAMCANLTESSKCATAAGCDGVFVGAISNAFQFMCMDNLDSSCFLTCLLMHFLAFSEVASQLACIQDSAGDLQQVCEAVCSVQGNAIDKAVKNTADELFSMESVCNSTHCLGDCYQENLPKYCDIGEDNVFDTIFSQLEALDEKQPGIFGYLKKDEQKKTGLGKILGWIMPNGCDDEKLKIKIPKKIPMPDKPKSVGSPPQIPKELASQKTATEEKNVTSRVILPEKSANLSSAAMMVDGKLQTMQCQLLDPSGNPVKTPDFETISRILAVSILHNKKENHNFSGTLQQEDIPQTYHNYSETRGTVPPVYPAEIR